MTTEDEMMRSKVTRYGHAAIDDMDGLDLFDRTAKAAGMVRAGLTYLLAASTGMTGDALAAAVLKCESDLADSIQRFGWGRR